jgi:cell division protein FtsW
MREGIFHKLRANFALFDKIDKPIFYTVIVLILLGVIFVFSSSFYIAVNLDVEPHYFSIRQIIWAAVSIAAFFFFILFDYKDLQKYVKPLVFITIVLMLMVFIPGLGRTSGGARRWLDLRAFSFNPSELAKITVIIYLSHILTKKQAKLENFTFGILPPLLLVAAIFFIILMQSGFSIAVVLLLVSFILFFVGGASIKHILSILVLSLPVLVVFIYNVAYRLERIFAYLNPWEDPSGRGYHIIQSLRAFAQGGLSGRGLGNSSQKIVSLPTPHTDFIYSVIAEETGIWGCLVILALYFVFFIRGIIIAFNCEDKFGQLLSFGIVSLFTLHALLNIGIATGIIPPTGVSLPFISYGGSSLLIMAVACGILLNISAHNKIKTKIRVKDVENIIEEGF